MLHGRLVWNTSNKNKILQKPRHKNKDLESTKTNCARKLNKLKAFKTEFCTIIWQWFCHDLFITLYLKYLQVWCFVHRDKKKCFIFTKPFNINVILCSFLLLKANTKLFTIQLKVIQWCRSIHIKVKIELVAFTKSNYWNRFFVIINDHYNLPLILIKYYVLTSMKNINS